jgi:bifunctional DNA-binding transcriptional regulator/antitoxin component of YhaV-PrlF toxin-antitoxin module
MHNILVMADFTKANKASPKSESLRTTIPNTVVSALNIKEGDKLLWDLQAVGNQMVVIFSKYESNTPFTMTLENNRLVAKGREEVQQSQK